MIGRSRSRGDKVKGVINLRGRKDIRLGSDVAER
jgi:hypothetical protein